MTFPDLTRYEYFAIDTETTGLRFWKDSIFGVAVSLPDGRDFYWDCRDYPKVFDWLRDQLPHTKLSIGHNYKFDLTFFRRHGIWVPEGTADCTMVRAALIDEHRLTYDLDSLGKDCVGVGKQVDLYEKLAALFGGRPTKDAQMPNLHRAPVALAATYAKQDTRTTLKLWEWQRDEIEKQGLERVAQLERELTPVIVDIEWGGVRVDVTGAEKAADLIDIQSRLLQKQLNAIAGFEVNPNPSASIHKLFEPTQNEAGIWILNDGTPAEKTEGGKASINADVLRDMKHPAAELILKLRKMIKVRDTFIRGHILSYHDNGLIHANYNQARSENDRGTVTGRLSVNSPALQQIPARDVDIASIVRSLFLPDDAQEWACWDWAQTDFRIMAHYVKNPVLLKAYRDDPNTDFHQLASELTGLPRKPRFAGDANAKQINLGLVFGMGMGKLAWEMGLPYTLSEYRGKAYMKPGPEAEAVFQRYHEAIPGVQDMLKNASAVAKDRGYVLTAMGRHIRFPGGRAVHKAGGLIFQGTAADMLKQKLIEVHKELKGTDSRLIASVHDEFGVSTPPGDSALKRRVSEILVEFDGVSTPISLRVPITVDLGVGPNWFEASK